MSPAKLFIGEINRWKNWPFSSNKNKITFEQREFS